MVNTHQKILLFINVFITILITSNSQAHEKKNLPLASNESDFHEVDPLDYAKFRLGQFLFFDKILSGNKNISCATCHHILTSTGDGLSLPIGEGAQGLSVIRNTGTGTNAVIERVPRNAPPIFALGAKSMTTLFHDGRVELDHKQPTGYKSPAGDELPHNLENILAVQAMFPVTSPTEMAGQAGENAIADQAAIGNLAGPNGVWEQLAERLRNIPEYVSLFNRAFDISQNEIRFTHAANAIAAFENLAWRANNAPFDQYLRGNGKAMSKSAKKGMKLFYGKAGCASCHSGVFQTDMKFHGIAMPQIGPGKGDGDSGYEDFGREAITGNRSQRYHFRTPPLRNVALTGPWGHSGAFNTLEAVVRHHLNPETSLMNYNCQSEPQLPSRSDLNQLDCYVMNHPDIVAEISQANELKAIDLDEHEVGYLLTFLNALTDPEHLDLRHDIPKRVPSGLTLVE